MPGGDVELLRTLLAEERQSLSAGQLAALGDLAARKAAIVQRLAAAPGDAAVFHSLRSEADANQRLIAAALRGVQAARARLRAICQAVTGTSVYTAEGRVMRCDAPSEKLEHRA